MNLDISIYPLFMRYYKEFYFYILETQHIQNNTSVLQQVLQRSDEGCVDEIDEGVKNKWRWEWLEETIDDYQKEHWLKSAALQFVHQKLQSSCSTRGTSQCSIIIH